MEGKKIVWEEGKWWGCHDGEVKEEGRRVGGVEKFKRIKWLFASLGRPITMSWSLLHALAWIKDQNFHNIDVEMEGKVIADKLYNNSIGRFDLQVLINKCKRFLLNFSNLVVSYVRW